MQSASKAYKEQLKKPLRRNEYIQISVGVINQKAQQTARLAEPEKLADWSAASLKERLDGLTYATPEEKFTKVDGSMVFLPREKSRIAYKNTVTAKEIGESIIFVFGVANLDIRGLTVDFGESYPREFTVSNGQYEYTYTSGSGNWSTDDIFIGSSYIKFTPVSMANGQNRLRIREIKFGKGVVFTNNEVMSFSYTGYVSPITDSVPSQDLSFQVENYKLAYSVDNPQSMLHFLEKGQEVTVSFGQTLEDGSVEWLKGMTASLKGWSSNDSQASFTALDVLSDYSSVYYRGVYRPEGITAYELGTDIFSDMGCEHYYLDPYLKNIVIRNPMPAVAHTEALQILANACRCAFSVDRDGAICIQSSFVPDMEARSDDAAKFSRTEDILNGEEKEWYGVPAKEFTAVGVNAGMYFLPRTRVFFPVNTGYMSSATADGSGNFPPNPMITIQLEAAFRCYGMEIDFHSVTPKQFVIHTYLNGSPADEKVVTDIEPKTIISDEFHAFDEMIIEFTKGSPDSRIAVDNILFEDVTDYELTYDNDLMSLPEASLQEKLGSISVVETVYSETGEEGKTLTDGSAYVSPEHDTCEVYFSEPSYGLSVICKTEGIDCRIKECSNYYAVLVFSGMKAQTYVEFSVTGKEYAASEIKFVKKHNEIGADYTWNNPLVDNEFMAKELEKWLAVYYDSAIDYQISYRGDPRIDADDLFYMELKDRSPVLVKSYQHKLDFNGAWSGAIKAAKVRNVYRTWDDVKEDYTWNTLHAAGITWSRLKARI